MTDTELEALATRIRNTLGCSKELAREYATGIGETPEVSHGKIIVRDQDRRIIAYVPASVFWSN